MLEGYDETLFQNLTTAKLMYDNGLLKQFLDASFHPTLMDEDPISIAWSAMGSVFPDMRPYFNEEFEYEIMVFFDPLIDEFCSLCLEYEKQSGQPLEDSHFRSEVLRALRDDFTFVGYVYNVEGYLHYMGHGRKRLLMFLGPEFYGYDELPRILLDIRDTLSGAIAELKRKLGWALIPFPMPPALKEAA